MVVAEETLVAATSEGNIDLVTGILVQPTSVCNIELLLIILELLSGKSTEKSTFSVTSSLSLCYLSQFLHYLQLKQQPSSP